MKKTSKYAEIRCDFYDEEERHWCIDAWLTDDDNEEGTIIATVDDNGNVAYLDPDAESDPYAYECIMECKEEMEKERRTEDVV